MMWSRGRERKIGWIVAALLVVVTRAAAQPPTAPALNGAALYQSRCGGCHSIAANRIGPAHKGVFGRKAGSAPNFNYSPALKGSRIVWNTSTLDRWLQGPPKMVPGTRMFLSVPNAAERAAIIDFLRSDAAK